MGRSLCLGALGAALLAHPLSLARLEIRLGEQAAIVELQVQTRTLLEVPGLVDDADGDGLLSDPEIRASWPEVRRYLEGGLHLELDGEAWLPAFEDFRLQESADGAVPTGLARWLVTEHRLPRDSAPTGLRVESSMFFDDGNPSHRCAVTVHGLTPDAQRYLLSTALRNATFPLQRGETGAAPVSPLWSYGQLGFLHVLEGFDHLAFLAGLLLGVAGWQALLAAVTAFTLAHSLTLAISALGWLALPPAIVEPGIALSILFVVWLHLAKGPGAARPWLWAGAFGLLHGFGFAGVLGEIGLPSGARVTSLLGFNLGVEAGQLAFVVPAAVVGSGLRRLFGAKRWPGVRLNVGMVLGAVGLALSSRSLVEQWWPALGLGGAAAAACLLGGAVAGLLRRRSTPDGQPLLPAAASSLLLVLLYQLGQTMGRVM